MRKAFHDLLAQGWTDAVRALHPGERIYTFWDYFRNAWARNAGLRIDHLLLSPSIVDRLRAAEVDRQVRGWEKAIMHRPGSSWRTLERAAFGCGEHQRRAWEEWGRRAHHFLDCEQSSMILSLRGSGLRRLASAAAWSRVTQRHTDGIAPAAISVR